MRKLPLLLFFLPLAVPASAQDVDLTVYDIKLAGNGIYFSPMTFVEMDGYQYFSADNRENGRELHRFKDNVVEAVNDVNPGTGHGFGRALGAVDGWLYFTATTNGFSSGSGFYRTQGIVGEFEPVTATTDTIRPIPTPESIRFGDFLYYSATDNANKYGYTLWRSNGAVTEVVDPSKGGINPRRMTILGDRLIFQNGSLTRINMFDGSEIESVPIPGGTLTGFTELGDWLYFGASRSLWRTDGIATEAVKNWSAASTGSWPFEKDVRDGYLYFFMEAVQGEGSKLWRTDGGEPELVAELRGQYLTPFQGELYFKGTPPGSNDSALYKTVGDTVEVIGPHGPNSPSVGYHGGWLYFQGTTDSQGIELWRTNGVTTEVAADIWIGSGGSGPVSFYTYTPMSLAGTSTERMLFTATAQQTGNELYCLGCSDQPLPVELASFRAVVHENSVELRWRTESEEDNAGFEVLHKTGPDWRPIAFVDGAGTSTQAADYDLLVSDLPSGRHQFRLRQVDLDGTSELSVVIEAVIAADGPVTISHAWPNPFSSATTLSVSVTTTHQGRVELFDMLGRNVKTLFEGQLEAGVVQEIRVDGTGLASGAYVARLTSDRVWNSGLIVLRP